MIVRELVTKIGFALNRGGLNESLKGLQTLTDKAKAAQSKLKTSYRILPNDQQFNFSEVKDRKFENILAYKKGLQELTTDERKETILLNTAEKQAIRETAAEKRKFDLEEKARLKELNRERKFTNFRQDLNALNRFATRSLLTTFATASASLGFSYSEFKKYRDKKNEGVTIKTSLTSEQLKQFDVFDKKITKFKSNIYGLRNSFSTALLPVLNPLVDNFNKWNESNKKIIDTNIGQFAEELSTSFKRVGEVFLVIAPKVKVFIDAVGGLHNVILALMGIKVASWLVGIGTVLSGTVGTVLLLTSSVAALYDEIKVTIEGGQSLINRFLLKKEGIKGAAAKKQERKGEEYLKVVNVNTGEEQSYNYATQLLEPIKSKKIDAVDFAKFGLGDFGLGDFSKFSNAQRLVNNGVNENKVNQINNLGGIKIVIENKGNIDEASIPKFTDMIQEEITKALSDTFAISKADMVS